MPMLTNLKNIKIYNHVNLSQVLGRWELATMNVKIVEQFHDKKTTQQQSRNKPSSTSAGTLPANCVY